MDDMIHTYVALNCMDRMIEYINNDGDIDVTDKVGRTPLIIAVKFSHYDLTKYLIENGADINKTDNFDNSSLIKGADKGDYNIVKYLIDNGAEVNHINKIGWSPITYAVSKGHYQITEYLINNHAIIEVDGNFGITPLIRATNNGHLDLVKLLVENRANVNKTNNGGWTPLIYAASKGHVEIAAYLIDNGAIVDHCTHLHKYTALTQAIENYHKNMIELLLPLSNLINFNIIDRIYEAVNNYIMSGIAVKIQKANVINKAMLDRDIDRYLCFCELFSIGVLPNNNDKSKYDEDSGMIGYDPPINEDEVRPFPAMFDSNKWESSFDATLAGVIFEFARDSLQGDLIIKIEEKESNDKVV